MQKFRSWCPVQKRTDNDVVNISRGQLKLCLYFLEVAQATYESEIRQYSKRGLSEYKAGSTRGLQDGEYIFWDVTPCRMLGAEMLFKVHGGFQQPGHSGIENSGCALVSNCVWDFPVAESWISFVPLTHTRVWNSDINQPLLLRFSAYKQSLREVQVKPSETCPSDSINYTPQKPRTQSNFLTVGAEAFCFHYRTIRRMNCLYVNNSTAVLHDSFLADNNPVQSVPV
jgi:hypothetical protein